MSTSATETSQILDTKNPRSGLKLMEDTLTSPTDNNKALGRILLAVNEGTLTVNGQKPDTNYPLGEYLIHGGRIKYDLRQLTNEEQEQFFTFITAGQAKSRAYATHHVGATDASGCPAEITPTLVDSFVGIVSDTFRFIFGPSQHYGINLAIGGIDIPAREGNPACHDQKPEENGEWGHMYLHKDTGIVLVGIEGSAPGTKNRRTDKDHSVTGTPADTSAFLEHKTGSDALYEEEVKLGKTPISTKERNNWATIAVSKEQFIAMKKAASTYEKSPESYSNLVNQTPKEAEKPLTNRLNQMNAWAKATENGNKPSLALQLVGALLIIAGIVLAFIPIPVVTQALGGSLVVMGIGIATGAAVLFGFGTARSPNDAAKLYEKDKTDIITSDDITDSTAAMLSGLKIDTPQSKIKSISTNELEKEVQLKPSAEVTQVHEHDNEDTPTNTPNIKN